MLTMPYRQLSCKDHCLSGAGKIAAVRHPANMATNKNYIKREREKLNVTQEELAEGIGISVSYLSRLENLRRKANVDHLNKVAGFLEVPVTNLVNDDPNVDLHNAVEPQPVRVCGDIAAGVWREASPFGNLHDPEAELHADKHPPVPYVLDPRYRRLTQFAVRVVGPSMNREIPDGWFAVCVRYWDVRVGLQDGDLVVVERRRGGLVEGTMKWLRRRNGKWGLHPDSDDPRYQSPVLLTDNTSAEADSPDIQIEIVGLVIWKCAPVG